MGFLEKACFAPRTGIGLSQKPDSVVAPPFLLPEALA